MNAQKVKRKLATAILLLVVPAIPVSVISISLQPAKAICNGSGPCKDVILCADDRPCIDRADQSGDKIIFHFDKQGWDFFNIRYARVGGEEKQVENRSGSYTFNKVRPNRVYTIKVQGCNSHFLGRSTCSPWSEESVTTR